MIRCGQNLGAVRSLPHFSAGWYLTACDPECTPSTKVPLCDPLNWNSWEERPGARRARQMIHLGPMLASTPPPHFFF